MAEDRGEQLKQAAANELQRQAAHRLWLWFLAGGAPLLGGGLVVLIAAVASTVLLAGVGNWLTNLFGPHPPAIATPLSRPAEWLLAATADANRLRIPNVLALAVIAQASDGQVFGDRYYCSDGRTAGERCSTAYHPGLGGIGPSGVHTLGIGYSLMGMNSGRLSIRSGDRHNVAWNLLTGLNALAGLSFAPNWQPFLNAFHGATQAPPGWQASGHYASTIKTLVRTYDSGPTLGAWALAPWSTKTGQFEDPGNAPEWVFAVGTAPDGAQGQHVWKPPSTVITCTPAGTCFSQTVDHILHYQDLAEPVQVWGKTASGQTVAFRLAPADSQIPVWSGGSVWGAQVALTGPHRLTQMTAYWANGTQDSIQWPEQAGGAVATVTTIPPAYRIAYWWPQIQVAASQTGVPSDWIAAEMSHESGGAQAAGVDGLSGAYGLMQLEPATARSLPGWYPGARQNPQANILLGAELLAQLHARLGSWRIASAAYYGGAGTVEAAGVTPGMPWAQAAPLLNFVPPYPGNTLTMAEYADTIVATAQVVVKNPPQ